MAGGPPLLAGIALARLCYETLRADAETLAPVAAAACAEGETIHNEPFPVTPDMVVAAMLAADAIGHERRVLLERTSVLPEACV